MALVASSESIGMTSVSMATQFAEQFGLQILELRLTLCLLTMY
ncbi:hypothetical protein JCM19239_1951 [Vibrio variabilis]|uniref:Uncharacterized protein n=1 Tax=Vibrio variabilis TaxID=990271 RepID=A0ABQ0J6V6_9VIBR|nr:hypothetical protein JCM19239_1951 [Vibrio variabilis]